MAATRRSRATRAGEATERASARTVLVAHSTDGGPDQSGSLRWRVVREDADHIVAEIPWFDAALSHSDEYAAYFADKDRVVTFDKATGRCVELPGSLCVDALRSYYLPEVTPSGPNWIGSLRTGVEETRAREEADRRARQPRGRLRRGAVNRPWIGPRAVLEHALLRLRADRDPESGDFVLSEDVVETDQRNVYRVEPSTRFYIDGVPATLVDKLPAGQSISGGPPPTPPPAGVR